MAALHPNDVNNRFRRHRPNGGDDGEQAEKVAKAHDILGNAARQLNTLFDGPSRDSSNVFTRLEEALHWSVAAIIKPTLGSDGSATR